MNISVGKIHCGSTAEIQGDTLRFLPFIFYFACGGLAPVNEANPHPVYLVRFMCGIHVVPMPISDRSLIYFYMMWISNKKLIGFSFQAEYTKIPLKNPC